MRFQVLTAVTEYYYLPRRNGVQSSRALLMFRNNLVLISSRRYKEGVSFTRMLKTTYQNTQRPLSCNWKVHHGHHKTLIPRTL
jgi:hypothetical protein